MSLSTDVINVLKVCKPLLEQHRDQIGVTFYNKLFTDFPETKNVFNMSHQTREGKPGIQPVTLANSLVAYATHCDNLAVLGPFVERVANKHVSFDVQPEQYPVVGGVLLATLEEVLGKETFNEDVKKAVAEAYFFLADIFINKESEMKKSLSEAPGGWTGWRKMKLVDKVVESPKHTSFMFIPEDGGELMEYKPGQYISIRLPPLPGTDHHHVRNYSLSDEPRTDLYRITVKREEEGAVSNHLHNNVTVGDVLDLGVPCGDFVLQPGSSCVFVGAGVGITPLLSMMKVSAKQGNKVETIIHVIVNSLCHFQNTLIYRASSAASHPFRSEIESVLSYEGTTVHWMYSENKVSENKKNQPLPLPLSLLGTRCRVYSW